MMHALKQKTVHTDGGTPYLTNVRIYLGDIVRSSREPLDYVGIIVDLIPDQPRYLVVEWQKFDDPTENRSMRFTEHMDDVKQQTHSSPPIEPPAYRAFVERRAAEVYEEGEP
jgi:hypothetical protein